MLKLKLKEKPKKWGSQPPSGGCVLKLLFLLAVIALKIQPPSGGCVLKLQIMPNWNLR